MIVCKLCGNEYNALGIHLRMKHKISVDDYLAQFPGAPTMTEESRKAYKASGEKRYSEGNLTAFINSAKEYAQSEENRKRLIAHNKDPKFIESQRERLSELATKTNKREWQENYEQSKERATRNVLKSLQAKRSPQQLIVGEYLESLGYNIEYEKLFINSENRRMLVDIYLNDFNIAIEINGESGHGDPTKRDPSQWSLHQRDGYERDLVKMDYFKDNLLFIWHSEIKDESYKSKLLEFLSDRSCKIG
jgi:hypothetical protein